MYMKRLIQFLLAGCSLIFSLNTMARDCSNLPTWDSASIYNSGDQVQHLQSAYEANWWTQNQAPDSHSGQWQEWTLLVACDGGGGGNQSPIANANGPYTGVVGSTITFSSAGSSDPDGSISNYQWDFGDGTTSSQSAPIHSYTTAGNYTITLTVTDNDGASNSASTSATITSDNGGGDCALPQYVVGTSYNAGDEVKNFGRAYRCNVAGWCSSTAAWAYEPGVGTYWQHAWADIGSCDGNGGGENQAPVAVVNGPYAGIANSTINFSSAGSTDPDGTITSYQWDFGDGSSSNQTNPSHSYANVGNYTVTLTVTDNENATASAATSVTVNSDGNGGGELPHRLLIGYWHNFDNGSGFIKMQDVIDDWDIINVSFAENKPGGEEGEVAFAPSGESETDFIAGVRMQQSLGKKVLISLGGANAHIQLNTTTARDNFVRTMSDIIARYGFDGMDIDLEGGSLNMNSGDTIANPQTPAIVNLISATRSLKSQFGANFVLTMAPETAYVQGGLTTFAGIWGAYLPLIHALRDDLTVLHVQHYNTGSLTATDGNIYQPGTADFHVSMSDMLITGFDAAGNPNNRFPGLRQDQVAFGLPSGTSSASSGYTTPAEAQRALDCLIKQQQCGNYQPAQSYPNFRGLMTWSINWDAFHGFEFSAPHRAYLNQNP